ncbi:WecB/TagA/CpsF family glycosyltransferase [Aureimonas fodinaquatilis]|uniref:WecB/TagA/CpsF family glycosyltransferase n=1 Tax=Aureimonas fodinaquatilis TaxID=2565783 RepID=A0A5B0DXG0_9HYPH|nr:WecB/TagA/CpsF family glycosyltransferase [Aureimonas fodinaquatilis]KAA0970431.1 WecB/TagA/CpsF family glycosyltransferase [Aureimonas fodinaquatilis]
MTLTVPFLGMRFLNTDMAGVRKVIGLWVDKGTYGYAVTPNVDHVVSYHNKRDPELRAAYDSAALHICDSRILTALARPSGRKLTPCPGSDLTRDLLADALTPDVQMAVIGPSHEAVLQLQAKYPDARITHISSHTRLQIGSCEWQRTVQRACDADWDILFVCLSFPKQEIFAHDLAKAGRTHGFALCVGASIDFLTGEQARAPAAMQKAGLEWLHRLAVSPRRMWKRYLWHGPSIFALAARQYMTDIRGLFATRNTGAAE